MDQDLDNGELTRHLCQNYGFNSDAAEKLVSEIVSYFSQTAEDFIRQRHRELQNAGQTNNSVFRQIQSELEGRRFPAPQYTERQIRRVIYG